MIEITVEDLKTELRLGAQVTLMVRHGERPKMDPDDPSFGDSLPLTYEGVRTARLLGASLAEFAGDVQFYASPLCRTRMTAKSIAEGMGLNDAEIPVDERLGNGSFYYSNALEVLDVFKPNNFFDACFEYFKTGEQRGFRNLYDASDEYERWIDSTQRQRLFVIATHDLYVAAFLYARNVGEFTRENWVRFLDGGAIIRRPDGTRSYALVRAGLSDGIVGVYRPQIKAVVFDFGGVMTVSTGPERARREIERLGLDWSQLERGFARYRRLMDGGYISLADLYELSLADADLKIDPEDLQRVVREDLSSFLDGYRNERTLAWMRELKAAGYKIGILTNMPTALSGDFRRVYAEYVQLADALVVSGEERMYKPQRCIYRLLRERIGLDAANLCFVDDVESNCDGARADGWHAIRFVDNDQVRRDFALLVG